MSIRPRISAALAQRKRWLEFLDFADRHGSPHWLFRGVADRNSHLLVPKIGRDPRRYNAATERVLFQNFRRRARQFVDTSGWSDWDVLALGQHHGLPTRLLDWSTNPLVAAFFAASSEPRNTDARVYAYQASDVIEPENTPDPFAITTTSVYIPSAIAARIVSQRGVFTVHPDPVAPIAPTGGMTGSHYFDIDAFNRPFFERRLFGLAIDASVIGSDLDGLCKTLNWQFDRGVALGKIGF